MFVLLIVSSSTAVAVTGGLTTAPSADPVPEDGPDYGVNNSTFQRLWSEDVDNGNLSTADFDDENVSSQSEFARRLAQSTDVPFERPPRAVERWNSGDFGDFSPGDRHHSVYPQSATLTNGTYIKDAYVSIFAVQPSTILHSGREAEQYIAPSGEVLVLSDYRVAVPEDDRNGSDRDRWSISQTEIESVELKVDGQTLDSGDSHQETLQYTNLSESPRLTVEVDITATLEHVSRTCDDYNDTAKACNGTWERDVTYPEETVTVTDSRQTTVNQFDDVSGKRVQFEANDNRVGAVVRPNTTWSSVIVDGEVRARSSWWFYTAGKSGWRTMTTSSANGASQSESTVRPVQTHAFPSEQAPYVPTQPNDNGDRPIDIEKAWGTEQTGPSLPSTIDLEPADPYVNAESVAVSSTTLNNSALHEITVQGIVRGQAPTVSLSEQQTVRETNLTLTVTEANATHAVVRAMVTENATGDVVTTGRVTIGNQTTALNNSGMAVITVSNPAVVVGGQYTSAAWWRTDQPYTASEDVVKTPANFPDVQTLLQLVVVTILWFIPVAALVFGFDYMSGGALLGLTNRT